MRTAWLPPTLARMTTSLEPELIGNVYRRGDEGYEEARRAAVWNARKPNRHPELIVTARSEADVVAAVRFARSRGLKVAVRSGGHSWFGASVRDSGLLLDLSELAAVSVDAGAGTAALQPSVRGREFAAALAPHDLGFPVGHCPSVALGGYLLAGGLGWNFGAWGPACLSVQAVEVVTAEGELVTADSRSNRELYWLARGSGPGFPGVVTRFHVSLFPLPRAITTSTYAYPVDDLDEIARWVEEARLALPPWVELILLLVSAPGGIGRVVVVNAVAFTDSSDDAAAELAVLETCPVRSTALLAEASRPASFDALFDGLGVHFPEGNRYQADTLSSNAELAELVGRARAHLAAAPSADSFVLAVPFGPRPGTASPIDAAFSPAAARAAVLTYAVWKHELDDARNVEWSQALVADLEPLASGFYVGETDLLASADRARRSFAEPNWLRINDLRIALDPEGLFHGYPSPQELSGRPGEPVNPGQ
jgi:FAD/FMN-containing dehydrogenase